MAEGRRQEKSSPACERTAELMKGLRVFNCVYHFAEVYRGVPMRRPPPAIPVPMARPVLCGRGHSPSRCGSCALLRRRENCMRHFLPDPDNCNCMHYFCCIQIKNARAESWRMQTNGCAKNGCAKNECALGWTKQHKCNIAKQNKVILF